MSRYEQVTAANNNFSVFQSDLPGIHHFCLVQPLYEVLDKILELVNLEHCNCHALSTLIAFVVGFDLINEVLKFRILFHSGTFDRICIVLLRLNEILTKLFSLDIT